MRRIILNIALVLVLFSLAPAALLAQDELTLESLAYRVDVAMHNVFELAARVELVETLLTPNPAIDEDGSCRLGIQERMHTMSMVTYLGKYEDSYTPNRITIENVFSFPDNTIAITIRVDASPNDRLVTEYYSGCEFLGISDWWLVDNSGERIDD